MMMSAKGEVPPERGNRRGGSELILVLWKGSVTRCDRMMMSAKGEVPPERGNRGDDASWTDANLTGPKSEENLHGRFNFYKWTVNI
jgi:hypothetical protein